MNAPTDATASRGNISVVWGWVAALVVAALVVGWVAVLCRDASVSKGR